MIDKLKPFQVQGFLIKFKSKANNAVEFVFETQENMTPEHMSKLIGLVDSLGWLSFNVRQIEINDIKDLPEPDSTLYSKGKTPSLRLRNVVYVLYKQKKGKDKDFPAYYAKAIETFIEQVKEKLD